MTIVVRNVPLLSVLWAAVCFTSPAGGQVTPSGGGYLFRMKHTAGNKYSYTMRMETLSKKLPNGKMVMNMPFRWEVGKVEGGVAPINMIVDPTEETGNQEITLRLTMDLRGKAVNKTTGKAFERLGVQFPEKPLKVGSAFRVTASPDAGVLGAAQAHDVYTFRGLRTVDGRNVAELRVTSTASAKNAKGGGSGVMLIDAADGYLYRYDYTQKITMTLKGETDTLEQKVTVRRR